MMPRMVSGGAGLRVGCRLLPFLAAVLAVALVDVPPAEGQAFAVNHIELVFENGRPDVTVPKNYPDLRAYGFVGFQGSGLFQAFWVVDGRIIGVVTEHVLPDQGIQIVSPAQPPLPTFEPGLHRVTLQIRTPQSLVRIPSITYFVTANEYQPPR